MSVETLQIIITLLGGLAVFIYGMNLMSDGLQKAAGDKMRAILGLLTKNPIVGVLAGAATTAIIQSSSATTVMVIGFVNARLMTLPQAISIILGANIGTTVTAQLVAFQIGDYAWAFVIVGFVMYFFLSKYKQIANIGQTIFAFGLLFIGLNTMAETMKPLASSPVFIDMMMAVKDTPVLGVLVGTVMTMIIQSSSASIAVLQNLAATAGPDGIHSIIGLAGAIPILFGTNIGTTITALLASIGGSVNAKRTAIAHTVFNIGGTLLFIWFTPYIAKFIEYVSPHGQELHVIARQIANAHLGFNMAATLVFLPFIGVLVKIVTKLIPGEDADKLISEPIYLDNNVIDRPFVAIMLATKELSRITNITLNMIARAKQAFLGNDLKAVNQVMEYENAVNNLQEQTVNYLASLYTSDSITEKQAKQIAGLLHIAADIEHIGDHCKNIAEFAEEKTNNGYDFSDSACAEIYECFDQAKRMTKDTIRALESGDTELANEVKKQEEEMNLTEERLRKQHMIRLNNKKCSPEFTVIYTDVIHNIEKIGDCCNNIAEVVLDDINFVNEEGHKDEKDINH